MITRVTLDKLTLGDVLLIRDATKKYFDQDLGAFGDEELWNLFTTLKKIDFEVVPDELG